MKTCINDYLLEKPLSTNNAGNCKWGFAYREHQRFFVKEFLDPVFPAVTDDLSESIILRKKKICREFEERQIALYKDINECATGGLQHIEEFFRVGSHYYITMKAIDEIDHTILLTDRSVQEVTRKRIAGVLIHNLACLHKIGIVHGDIKMDNISFYKLPKNYGYSARIIDFEDAFRVEQPPETGEDVHGDQVYLAPETFRFMCGDNIRLTPAIDCFALGLVLYQVLTKMRLPGFDKKRFTYPFEALVYGESLSFDGAHIEEPLATIVRRLLIADPEKRMSLEEADAMLHGRDSVVSDAEDEKGEKKREASNSSSDPVEFIDKNESGGVEAEQQEQSIIPSPELIVGRGFEKIFGVDAYKRPQNDDAGEKMEDDPFFRAPGNLK